jgi:hypothetical protein
MRLAGGIISKRCLSGTEKQRPLSGRHLLTKATTLHQRSSGKSFKRDCQKRKDLGKPYLMLPLVRLKLVRRLSYPSKHWVTSLKSLSQKMPLLDFRSGILRNLYGSGNWVQANDCQSRLNQIGVS